MLFPPASFEPSVVLGPHRLQAHVCRDLVLLTKPRVTVIVLATTCAGIRLAPGGLSTLSCGLTLLGTLLVVSSANVLNMWWEREADALMLRTRTRPLPDGRLTPGVALGFGLLLASLSLPMLFWVNRWSGYLGLFALLSYVLVYTPMKRWSPWALQVGAIPGAIPPLLGWTSVTGAPSLHGLLLFALLFFWQIPHFVAIALCRREEYAHAGFRVYSVAHSVKESKTMLVFSSTLLLGASLLPWGYGLAGGGYGLAALGLSLGFLGLSASGFWCPSSAQGPSLSPNEHRWARTLFSLSIVYLILLFVALLSDRVYP